MKLEWVLAIIQLGVAIQRFYHGNIPMGLYWLCATGLVVIIALRG